MGGRPWTKEESDYLKKYGSTKTCEEIANEIGRTKRSVQHEFNNLGLKKKQAQIGDVVNGWKIIDIYIKNIGSQNVKIAKVISTLGNNKESQYRLTKFTKGDVGWPDRRRPDIKFRNSSHGLTNHRLYSIWSGMKTRCSNPKQLAYKDYGGRGILICDDWIKDFKNFYDWAINNGYEEELTLDRIDVDDNYKPENCRWITFGDQAWNKRCSIKQTVTIFGETKTVHDWIKDERCILDNVTTLIYRLGSGWNPEKAISHPSERKPKSSNKIKLYEFVEQKYPELIKEYLEQA